MWTKKAKDKVKHPAAGRILILVDIVSTISLANIAVFFSEGTAILNAHQRTFSEQCGFEVLEQNRLSQLLINDWNDKVINSLQASRSYKAEPKNYATSFFLPDSNQGERSNNRPLALAKPDSDISMLSFLCVSVMLVPCFGACSKFAELITVLERKLRVFARLNRKCKMSTTPPG